MQGYLIGVRDYIGLLMAYISYMCKVDAPDNPSHYREYFWIKVFYILVFKNDRCPLFSNEVKFCSQSVLKRNL